MTVEKRLENALSISESIKNRKMTFLQFLKKRE